MDSYHLTIVKLEGLNEVSNSYLYIYSGPLILRVLTLNNLHISPIPIHKSTLRFVVEDSINSSIQASLTFKSSLISRYGFHWLPLYEDSEIILSSIPDQVSNPRILIDVSSNLLSPVEEITEDSESFIEISQTSINEDLQILKAENIELSLRIIELEDLLKSQKLSFDEEIEVIKEEFAGIVKVYEEGLVEWEIKEVLIEELRECIEAKEEKLVEMDREVSEVRREMKMVKDREDSFIRTLEQKDSEIFYLRFKSRGNLEVLTQEPVQCLARPQESKLKEINFDSNSLPVANNQKFMNLSSNTASSLSTEHESKTCQTGFDADRNSLIKKLYDAEVALTSFKLKNLEELDTKIKKLLINKNLENHSHLCNELSYTIKATKVILFPKGDLIYCKHKGLTHKFDNFLNSHFSLKDSNKKSSIKSPSKALRALSNLNKLNKLNKLNNLSSNIAHKASDHPVRSQSPHKSSIPSGTQSINPQTSLI